MNNEQMIPSAIILPEIQPTDYVRGSGGQSIIHEDRVLNADWTAWLPSYEPQKFKFDTNECSQLSGINDVATQCNYLKANGKFSEVALKWFTDNGYFDENGSFAFSERYSGILSGTTINGNSPITFWKTATDYGLLPRKDLNFSMDESSIYTTQAEMCTAYYDPKVITAEMYAKAKKALNYITIQYQWIGKVPNTVSPDSEIKDALKQSPVQICTAACMATWNTGVVQYCGRTNIDHATMIYKMGDDNTHYIRDHYNPANKTLSPDYLIALATQGVVTAAPELSSKFKHTFTTDLTYGDQGQEVKDLQTALATMGYLEPRYITGNYLDKTSAALLNFQLDKSVLWSVLLYPLQGHYCYTRTRKALNILFSGTN